MTPSGIKPVTFQFVAQYLNHCYTTIPLYLYGNELFCYSFNKIMAITNDGFLQRNGNQILQTM